MKLGTPCFINSVPHEVRCEALAPAEKSLYQAALGSAAGFAATPALPAGWTPGPPSEAHGEMAVQLTKTLLDALPPLADLGTGIDAIGAVVAAADLVRGAPEGATQAEKVLVYSKSVVDIAVFVADIVPGMHALGTPLNILSFVLKQGQEVHQVTLTPKPDYFFNSSTSAGTTWKRSPTMP